MRADQTTSPPYSSDIEYLMDEIEHIRCRSRRIGLQRELSESEPTPPKRGVVGPNIDTEHEELRRRCQPLETEEQRLRQMIDARLRATQEAGVSLGLESITKEHDLDQFSRTVLLLATISALDTDHQSLLEKLAPSGFGCCSLTPEMVWAYLEFTLEDTLLARVALLPEAPLLQNDLVLLRVGENSNPGDYPGAGIEVSSEAFAQVVGMPELSRQGGR